MKVGDFLERPMIQRPIRYRSERRVGAKIIYRAMKKAGKMKKRDNG